VRVRRAFVLCRTATNATVAMASDGSTHYERHTPPRQIRFLSRNLIWLIASIHLCPQGEVVVGTHGGRAMACTPTTVPTV